MKSLLSSVFLLACTAVVLYFSGINFFSVLAVACAFISLSISVYLFLRGGQDDKQQ